MKPGSHHQSRRLFRGMPARYVLVVCACSVAEKDVLIVTCYVCWRPLCSTSSSPMKDTRRVVCVMSTDNWQSAESRDTGCE